MHATEEYPHFMPLDITMASELYPYCNNLTDGISEFSFPSLYFHRNKYKYYIARTSNGGYVISGAYKSKRFFLTPDRPPEYSALDELFAAHDLWKLIPQSCASYARGYAESRGFEFADDRDNWDYLYERARLADLSGKQLHKKRNLVNRFKERYSYTVQPLTPENCADAVSVLEQWRLARPAAAANAETDYEPAMEALRNIEIFQLSGILIYVDGAPAGWCLGETMANGSMYAVHFEKGLENFTGVYQALNQIFCQTLPEHIRLVNREQDLGDEGLRQAKLTYRPADFVKKYACRKILENHRGA